MKKKFTAFLLCAFVLFGCTACSDGGNVAEVKAFDRETASQKPDGEAVAQNSRFTLSFENDTCGVILTENATGNKWGTSPPDTGEIKLDEWGDPVTRHPQVDSVLFVEYVSAETGNTDSVISKTGAVKEGRIVCKNKEKGIRIEYYFDSTGFMIPVDYTLRDDGLLMTINPADIEESENVITSVSLAPFFCAAENDAENSYLMVPSGSGTLIYPKSVSQQGTNYSSQVYGEDASIEKWDMPSSEKSVRMPVYGAKTGDAAIFAVIESGAESAEINVTSGSKALGYSSVYTSFILRGYTNNIADLMPGERVKNVIYSDYMIDTPLSIGFYPLTGDSADYSGMAKLYKSYLEEQEGLQKSNEESPLNINIIGGATVSKSFLGIPYKSLFASTDTKEAQVIIEKLIGDGITPSVRLTGFGTDGISTDTLAGGFKISSKLGGTKGVNTLLDYCKDNGVNAYLDYDIIRFKSGAAGFSTMFDSALCASRKIAYIYDFDIATRGRDEDTRARLIARDKLVECGDTLLKKTSSVNAEGYSFDTLSSIAYSDYSDRASASTYSKSGMAEDVKKIMTAFSDSDKKIAVSDANIYAAVKASLITETPTSSSAEDIFDTDIPFYQMVFRGIVPIATESVNLAASAKNQVLKAVEGGCGLTYTVIANYDKSLLDIRTKDFYNSLFDDVYPQIKANAEELKDYYEKISGAEIIKHTVVSDSLRSTSFNNGITVYVNFGDKTEQTPFGAVEPQGFVIGGVESAQE